MNSRHVVELRNVIREQTGRPEADFAANLEPLFQRHIAVARAFLAQVEYGPEEGGGVALLIESPEDPALADSVGDVFAGMFKTDQGLDIFFLEPPRGAEIASKIRPFYVRTLGVGH